MQIISFHIADGLYGIPVLLAKEFFRPVPVTPVPLSDPRVEGLIHVRGKTATVLDLRRCLGKPPRAEGQSSKMILLEPENELTDEARELRIRAHEESVALHVDATGRIFSVPVADILPRPAHIEHECVEGIVRLEGGYLMVLGIRTLIDAILAEAARETGAKA